jgi:hypothetical protein
MGDIYEAINLWCSDGIVETARERLIDTPERMNIRLNDLYAGLMQVRPGSNDSRDLLRRIEELEKRMKDNEPKN